MDGMEANHAKNVVAAAWSSRLSSQEEAPGQKTKFEDVASSFRCVSLWQKLKFCVCFCTWKMGGKLVYLGV